MAIREEVVRGVLLCVQDFVRDPVFTQRSFFSESDVEMLSEAAAVSDSITSSSLYAPWSEVENESSGQIVADLKTCFERHLVVVVSSRYALGAVLPLSGKSSSQYDVCISTVVEEWQVDYVPVVAPSRKVAGHSRHLSSPGKAKKKVSRSSVKLLHEFEVSSPVASSRKRAVVDDSSFASALASESPRENTRKRG